jgi:O-antigen/teichoic acid export membrane protein
MPLPKYNLAAYGVAFSFALIAEAPIIMIMSAAAALVDNKHSYIKLRNFTNFLNVLLTGIMAICLIPPIFDFIATDLISLPDKVSELTHTALIILLPWPGTIGFRRFYQGILIKSNKTKWVAYGTVIRVVTMSITAYILYSFTNTSGVLVGAFALSAGVIFEAVAGRLMSISAVRNLLSEKDEKTSGNKLTYREIINFYYPLALTSIISLGVHPIVTFFMGQSRMPLESLAVLPVINSLVFIFRAIGLSYQEVGIVLMGEKMEGYIKLRNFAVAVGLGVGAALVIVAFTPLSNVWFRQVSGLSESLAQFAVFPLQIISIIPPLSFILAFQRAVIVYSRKTKPVTYATILEVTTIVVTLLLFTQYVNLIGAVAAVSALLIGRIAANVFLIKPFKDVVNTRNA